MKLVAILDNIRSLYNVGSMFRTADGLGVEKLYLCGITGTPKSELANRRISKTALGAQEVVSWEYFDHAIDAMEVLKKDGWTVVALEQTPSSINLKSFIEQILNYNIEIRNKSEILNSQNIFRNSDLGFRNFKLCLVVGHELYGVSADVLTVADCIVHIPMVGKKESLNVAVAFGIAVALIKPTPS